jgi:RecA/RadA recombinase
MVRRSFKSTKKADRERLKSFSAVVDQLDGWAPASDSLSVIKSVPTIFPQINIGTRIGGWPLQRICVIHGPSNNGKTIFGLGLGLSFLIGGHFFGFVDAELTTPITWVKSLMGKWADHPGFLVHHPKSYENTVDRIRSLVERIAESRVKGIIDDDVGLLLGVDSIRKLVPKRLVEKIIKEGADKKEGSIDGMKGRAAMYKAALNSAWLDELTPLMHFTNSSIFFIGRESENTDQTNLYSPDWKLTGGKGLVFDSSLLIRITREKWLREGSRDNAKIIGERHCAQIYKTKVGGKEDKVVNCYFHTSNGVMIREGFDRARDVIDLAKQCGVIKVKGSWLEVISTGECWQGENKAVKYLTENKSTLNMLETEVIEACNPELLEVDQDDD